MENKKIIIIFAILILTGLICFGRVKTYSSKYESDKIYTPKSNEILQEIETETAPRIIVKQEKILPGLISIARNKINDLQTTGYWSHTNSNGCNFHCRVGSYLVSQGGKYTWIGENLYKGNCSVDNAYRLWRLSPTHNEVLKHEYDEQILLTGKYGETGCYYVLIKGVVK